MPADAMTRAAWFAAFARGAEVAPTRQVEAGASYVRELLVRDYDHPDTTRRDVLLELKAIYDRELAGRPEERYLDPTIVETRSLIDSFVNRVVEAPTQ